MTTDDIMALAYEYADAASAVAELSYEAWHSQDVKLERIRSEAFYKEALREAIDKLVTETRAAALKDLTDTERLDFIEIYGTFGVDSASGKPGGNGQVRLAATRKNIDAARSKT